jgi:hypothetical protein
LQKFEFLSLEQGQSKQIPGRLRRRATPARTQVALAFGPSTRAPRLAARPEAHSPKPRTSRGHLEVLPLLTPRGRAGTGRTAGRSSVSPAVHSCRGRRLLLDVAVGLLGRWQAHLSPIKWSLPFSSRPCRDRAAAGAIAGSRGELQARSAAHQSKPFPTFPCTSPSSPACPFPPPSRHLAGTAVAAADAARRRRTRLAGPSPPQPSPGIGPLGPKGQTPPAPGRPRPAVRRNLAGPPPAGAQGPNCESPILSRGPSAQQGYICDPLKNSRGLLESVF